MVRSAVAAAGGREDPQGAPTSGNRGTGASEHGARVAIQEDHAPPCDAVAGNVHLAPINSWLRAQQRVRPQNGASTGPPSDVPPAESGGDAAYSSLDRTA
jgi:hypothetical protein